MKNFLVTIGEFHRAVKRLNRCLYVYEKLQLDTVWKSPKESLHHPSGKEGCLRVVIKADKQLSVDSHMTTHDNTIEDVHIQSFLSSLLICLLMDFSYLYSAALSRMIRNHEEDVS